MSAWRKISTSTSCEIMICGSRKVCGSSYALLGLVFRIDVFPSFPMCESFLTKERSSQEKSHSNGVKVVGELYLQEGLKPSERIS